MNRSVIFLLQSFEGGGVERLFIELAHELESLGCKIEFVVCNNIGILQDTFPPHFPLRILRPSYGFASYFRRLKLAFRCGLSFFGYVCLLLDVRYFLRQTSVLEDFMEHLKNRGSCSVLLGRKSLDIWYGFLSGFGCRVIASEHMHLSSPRSFFSWRSLVRDYWLREILHYGYGHANGIIAVSDGVAASLSDRIGIDRDSITTIYNAVIPDSRRIMRDAPCPHPWIGEDIPVILSAGRLISQKDYPTLLRAFSILRRKRMVRLVILGEGKELNNLSSLASELGITSDVDFAGFVMNPLCYMNGSSVFALSSRSEGLGNVLIEALYCGCPIVSTDCPSGPSEILDGGKYGRLVSVGDFKGFARALDAVLDAPVDKAFLRSRAEDFSSDVIMPQYEALLFGRFNES